MQVEPRGARVAAAVRVVAHVRRAAEAGSRPRVTVDELPSPSICSVEPMNMSTAYCPASWHSTRFERKEPSRPVKNTSGRARV